MRELGILKEGETLNNANSEAKHAELWKKVDLKEVEAFDATLEPTYSPYWIKKGKNQKEAVDKIAKSLEGQKLKIFKLGRESRTLKLLPKIATGLAILGAVGEGAAMAPGILNPDKEQTAAWDNFENQYKISLEQKESLGRIRRDRAHHLRQAFIDYLTAIKTTPNAISEINGILTMQIETDLEP